ncbi:TonB-dependent receptor [Phenylobacterium sp.]|uniref:TonB-dependent receptor n=1 Tax=Phenylobacterium sp. TaxID=1871053 RepID=UPI0025F2DC0B|nr:TonB-dependent receptor [Phenylobacterium sp.]MCA6227728.1 TonB-dependent receptor [Phenylobacterium sp.]
MQRKILITGAAIAALMTAAPALAQTASEGVDLSELVVTAQKREQKLQDVPAAISVLSGDALAARGSVNLESAQYLVPTLNFRKSGTTINQTLFLRGVGTSTFSIAGEPSVSTVVDGVVLSRSGEAFSDLIDVERIEVLRGPQGTLFGKNTSAGVINIVTKRPGDDFGGYVEGGYFSSGGAGKLRAGVDVPFSDLVKGRFTVSYGSYDGNIRNLTRGTRVNGYEHWGVRGVIVADPREDLSLTLIADYRESDDDCCAELIGTTPTNLTATVLPTPRGDRTRHVTQDLITSTKEESGGVSLQADWSVGGNVVTYIGSYRQYDNTEIRDGDWLPQAYVGFNQLHDLGPQTSNTVTQELRLTSPADQTLTYVVGAYYSRAETDRTFTRNNIVCTLAPTPTVLTPCTAPGTVITRPSGTATFGSVFTNYALFGQGEANLTDRFRLIAGLRFTSDELSVNHQRVSPLTGPGIQPSFGPFTASTSNDNLSGKAGAQFDLSDDSTAYATYSRGYKGPAYNVFFNLTATGTNVIEAETADSFEVGLKNTLLDGRLILNLAAYYATYDNFQANNPDLVAGVVVTRFTNAGTISTRGAELDFLFRPMADLNVSGGLAYTDAKVDQFKLPTNGVITGVIPSGTPLAYAPRWKGSVAIDYRIRDVGPVDVILGAQGSFQSKQLSQFDANAAVRNVTTIGGYGLVDLSMGIADRDDRYQITAQVKNLFDESFASAITSGGPGGSYRYLIPREADRYYGVTARLNF